MELSNAEQLFLEILRHAMWKEGTFDVSDNYSTKDLKKVLKISHEQAVIGLVGDILVNRSNNVLPASIGTEIGFLVIKVQTRHKLVNSTIKKVVSEFKAHNIETTLLKGQGIASLYPTDTLRQSGDIDLYVHKEIFEQACNVLSKLSDDHNKDYTTLKHFGCECNGVEIELHRYSDYLSFRNRKNNHFQKLSLQGLCNTGRTIVIDNIQVQLPTGYYDSIFILQHLWNHLITGGVGFRQLCDWMMVVNKFYDTIDTNNLTQDLKACGLYNAWKYISYICVKYLGLEPEKCPLFDDNEITRNNAEELIRIIFDDGNFGWKNGKKNNEGRPDNFIGSKLHSLRNNMRRLNKTIKFVDKSDRLAYYLEYLRSTTDRL